MGFPKNNAQDEDDKESHYSFSPIQTWALRRVILEGWQLWRWRSHYSQWARSHLRVVTYDTPKHVNAQDGEYHFSQWPVYAWMLCFQTATTIKMKNPIIVNRLIPNLALCCMASKEPKPSRGRIPLFSMDLFTPKCCVARIPEWENAPDEESYYS